MCKIYVCYDEIINTFDKIISMCVRYTTYFLLAINYSCPWIVTLNGLCDMKGKTRYHVQRSGYESTSLVFRFNKYCEANNFKMGILPHEIFTYFLRLN